MLESVHFVGLASMIFAAVVAVSAGCGGKVIVDTESSTGSNGGSSSSTASGVPECIADNDCLCADGTIGLCLNGSCDAGVCAPSTDCVDDTDCPCNDGSGNLGICEDNGLCNLALCDAAGCVDDSDCNDGCACDAGFGECECVGSSCFNDSDCDCGDGTLGVCSAEGICDFSVCGEGKNPPPDCSCGCDFLVSQGGCKDLCGFQSDGTPGYCEDTLASKECVNCLQTTCGFTFSQTQDGSSCL